MASRNAQQAAAEIFDMAQDDICLRESFEEPIERHIAAALAEQEAEQWIDVREKLPKSDEPVWAWNDATELGEVAEWTGEAWLDDTLNKNDLTGAITHWRALPAPPANTKKAGN